MRRNVLVLLVTLVAAAAVAAGCAGPESSQAPPQQMRTGDPGRGAALISHYGCGSCHEVPGVAGADGLVGPPLTHFSRRGYVAGVLPNSEQNLEHWIEDPQSVVPGNAMPDLGVTHRDAIDITAYLYTLR
ncbi:c-type cytochrome [Nocardioides terrisoli]|uniref:c-type cytochrome n=1 Tax=Nocardioides terrisoli TaxID=3388267 RepID=UPI00287B7DA6|nr:c-type cytochrome [Nocardioides marmorisolisilvae]